MSWEAAIRHVSQYNFTLLRCTSSTKAHYVRQKPGCPRQSLPSHWTSALVQLGLISFHCLSPGFYAFGKDSSNRQPLFSVRTHVFQWGSAPGHTAPMSLFTESAGFLPEAWAETALRRGCWLFTLPLRSCVPTQPRRSSDWSLPLATSTSFTG